MKAGIFEMEHFETAYPVIQLFDMPANELVIFTDARTYQRFQDLFKQDIGRFQWEILSTTGSKWRFFRQLYTAAKKHRLDLFYVSTISNNHLLYAWVIGLLRIARVVLTVHDINCMFNSRWSLRVRPLIHHIGKKALVKRVKEFNVIADTMVDHLRKFTPPHALIHNIPGSVFQGQQQALAIDDHLHLVVAGTLDKKRRDYVTVFELLKAAEASQLPLQITLAGGYVDEYGKRIVQQAMALKTTYTKIRVYDTSLVHQDEYNKQLDNAHFIFVPSVINTTICFDIPETYGITKSSGNMFDVIRHARPFIAPQGLRISPTIESSCFRYTRIDEIINFLNGLFQKKSEYEQWQQRALVNSKQYTVAKVRERNPALFATG